MALVARNITGFQHVFAHVHRCCYSKSVQQEIKKNCSKDIYTNLALEDWIYRNFDLKNQHILMLWQNEPCIVIGRHQNPWLETNFPELPNITEQGVKLARRNSGGGTVFHDLGNLNLTFFTPREHYDRKYNLEILTRSLFREFGLKAEISPRKDLTVRNYKVSGTASKLGRPNAYHHCTLLVKTNKVDLSLALQRHEVDIETNATKSIKTKIMNLCEDNPDVSINKLRKAIGWEYMRTTALTIRDGGLHLANKQKGFQMDSQKIRDQYTSWEWCYGKTPKFNISKTFSVPETLISSYGASCDLKITMTVECGKISDISLYIPPGLSSSGFSGNANVISSLIGHKFSEEALNILENLLGGYVDEKEKFVSECLKQLLCLI
ncbi:hypothetical protein NQ317_013200 [Molorchus minor]|uniref:BPL/LPL catalytic domain-containing protein n=1 Tax=Molorchus minor TaxID=1323400 RepID=A0ABQ9K1G5_9CUCU|nr:hypothetical protein NQ317_013200 [Molorchus minor]